MARRARGRHLLAAGVVVASSLTVLGASSAGTATAASSLRVLANSVPRALAPGSLVVGTLAPATPVRFEVELHAHDAAALSALIAGLYNPRSPLFHRFLTPAQFTARFGASGTELAAIGAWLRLDGLSPLSVSQNRLSVVAEAPSGVVAAALRTSFAAIRMPSGRLSFANRVAPSVPATIAPFVSGIVGLDDLPAVHTDLVSGTRSDARTVVTRGHPLTSGPRACAGAVAAASAYGSFTAAGLAAHYSMSPLYALGDYGQGVKVGIAEFESNDTTDIAAFQSCYHTNASVHYVTVDAGAPPGPGMGEAALDIENVIGLVPRSVIDVYRTPNTDLGDTDMYAKMVADDDKVLTSSWGSCEIETTPSVISAEAGTFQEASVQGEVVFAAAGDSGSTDCFGAVAPPWPDSDNYTLSVDDPGSQPYRLSVGGTTATGTGEVVWNDGSGGGGGGGLSTSHCMPSYQDNTAVPDLINANSTVNTTLCPTGIAYEREVPDVTAVADPSTGYTIFYESNWTSLGGTSGAAPLWAAASALVLASPYCSAFGSKVGVTPQGLYALAATKSYSSALTDITRGNNAVTLSGYSGGLYPARKGFDEASGLGSPSLTYYGAGGGPDLFHPGLASLLCYAARTKMLAVHVTGVSPRRLASNAPTAVIITGSGFLPILGADRVVVDGEAVTASCSTSTRCTATVPGRHAATVDLHVQLQTYATSPASAADKVTFEIGRASCRERV